MFYVIKNNKNINIISRKYILLYSFMKIIIQTTNE